MIPGTGVYDFLPVKAIWSAIVFSRKIVRNPAFINYDGLDRKSDKKIFFKFLQTVVETIVDPSFKNLYSPEDRTFIQKEIKNGFRRSGLLYTNSDLKSN